MPLLLVVKVTTHEVPEPAAALAVQGRRGFWLYVPTIEFATACGLSVEPMPFVKSSPSSCASHVPVVVHAPSIVIVAVPAVAPLASAAGAQYKGTLGSWASET